MHSHFATLTTSDDCQCHRTGAVRRCAHAVELFHVRHSRHCMDAAVVNLESKLESGFRRGCCQPIQTFELAGGAIR